MKTSLYGAMFSLLISAPLHAESFLIQLTDPLDDKASYCMDVQGWSEHLKLEDTLQAHTCKTKSNDDQLFVQKGKMLKLTAYDRCLTVSCSNRNPLPGSALIARECNS